MGIAAGIIYAAVTVLQWRDLRRNFRVDERAWVGPLSTAIASEDTPDGSGVIFEIPYTNTGKTPALKISSWIGQTSDMKSIRDHEPASDDIAQGMLMPSGVMNTSTADHPISKTDAGDAATVRLGAF